MFGVKKKETEKMIKKVDKKGVEDEIQFDFEEDDNLPFDDDEGFADDDAIDEPAPRGLRKTVPQRSLFLPGALLLLALLGGGYYYLNLNSPPAPPAISPAPAKTIVKAPATAPPAASPAPVAAVKPVSPVAVAPAPVKSPQPAAAEKAQAVPVAKVVPVVKTTIPVAAVTVPVDKNEVASPPATRQPFTLSVGAFISQKHQREVEQKIRRLGYTPKVQTTYSMVPMIRLLLGVYEPAAAEARQKELSAQVPDLFTLKQGDKVALYAGSYQSLDLARSFSDQLYLRGILVDEETVSLRMPLKKISYGSFSSRAAAEKAAKRAAAAGLSAHVVKR